MYIMPKKEGEGHFCGFRTFWGIWNLKMWGGVKPDISSFVAGSCSLPKRILTEQLLKHLLKSFGVLTTLMTDPCSWSLAFPAQELQDLRAFLYPPGRPFGLHSGDYLPSTFCDLFLLFLGFPLSLRKSMAYSVVLSAVKEIPGTTVGIRVPYHSLQHNDI